MAVRRYAVLDANGVKINTILIDDPMPTDYWPGYGAYLMDEGPSKPIQGNDAGPTIGASALPVLEVTPNKVMQIGDTININNGQVTKFVPQLIEQTGPDGNPITVASAPQVRLDKRPPIAIIRRPQ